jgi:NADPH:quinone reductase-like Zn-dependent oxidoreductase
VEGNDKSLIGKRVCGTFYRLIQVAGCVHSGFEIGNGAYQEYVKVNKALTIPLPDNLPFEEEAALPLASIIAALVIFQKLRFPKPGEGEKEVPFLVWGGSSSVVNLQISQVDQVFRLCLIT